MPSQEPPCLDQATSQRTPVIQSHRGKGIFECFLPVTMRTWVTMRSHRHRVRGLHLNGRRKGSGSSRQQNSVHIPEKSSPGHRRNCWHGWRCDSYRNPQAVVYHHVAKPRTRKSDGANIANLARLLLVCQQHPSERMPRVQNLHTGRSGRRVSRRPEF